MPLSKLSIFSKNTDANAVLKGYEYQKLRTLESWLSNKVNKVDEIIYCEYEDDIFQRNIEAGASKFTQIKLYGSKAFSFKSEEITKAVANFFMLFVKGEYSFDNVQFVFETNTAIAGKYGDNDAELLKNWATQQDNLDAELLQKCAAKVNSILQDYVNEEYPKVEKTQKSEAQAALIDFNALPGSIWEDFARTIRWVFNSESPDSAIEATFNSINEHIGQLPFPSSEVNSDAVLTTLYYEVSVRMFQNEPEDRCLTNERLDSLMLDLGDEADKQYNLAFEAWNGTVEIGHFNLAEFLEVLHAAIHCRWSGYLEEHSEVWLNLLAQYFLLDETPEQYKRKAIYEYLWLKLRPEKLAVPKGTLIGQDEKIKQYFGRAGEFDNYDTIEDCLSLLQIVRTSILMGKCDLAIEQTTEWMKKIISIITKKIEIINNPNEKCYWLELQSIYLSDPFNFDEEHSNLDGLSFVYKQLIELLPNAPLYNVTRLNNRLNQYIKIYLEVETGEIYISKLEGFADSLMPMVAARKGNYELAKTYVDRGIKYLHSANPQHLRKALSYFHKAKDLWLQEETVSGYVLALLNISQVYSALSMNLAAKYYALGAAWFSINNHPEDLANRIAQAFGLLVYCDYKQGSWIHAINDFEYYIKARFEFDNRPLDQEDLLLTKSFFLIASVLTIVPEISYQLTGFIEFQKQRMGDVYNEFIDPSVQQYKSFLEKESIKNHIQDKLDSPPLNDIGTKRTIEWKALGSTWSVTFENSWVMNSLGEEFSSVLQIMLVELAGSSDDLHFLRTKVEIELLESQEYKSPEQLPSNHSFKWKIFSKNVDQANSEQIRSQMAFLVLSIQYLLRDVSMLNDEKVSEIINRLFQQDALAEKTMAVNLFQRIYRGLFTQESFKDSQRNIFCIERIEIDLRENKALEWNSDLSPHYSHADSLGQIEGRYKNILGATHMTLAHLKRQNEYKDWLNQLRAVGWLDWQILLAVYNHILSYKANRVIEGKKFESDDMARAEFERAFHEIRQKDENENYVEFPLDYFAGKEFQFALEQTAHTVLPTLGLQNRARFPNFPAIKDFLNHRFNFGVDDIPEHSSL